MTNTLASALSITLSVMDFDYTLPENLIAKYPLEQRDASRMMILNRAENNYTDAQFCELSNFISPGDLLVLNNAKVSPVRLIGHKDVHQGEVEIFLLHPQNAEQTEWLALIRPAKRLREGTIVVFDNSELKVTILERQESGRARVQLSWPDSLSFNEMLEGVGQMPLPPYMSRSAEESDKYRYQTVFAKTPGAQAAPTAGLHFTESTLKTLEDKGVQIAELTLYVSAGTFRPVKAENITEHKMDPEAYEFSQELADKILATKKSGNKVIAVGTTVAKTLETVAHKYNGVLKADSGWSELFITPGFDFKIVDALLTNFHLPKSTLLMLISAFAGNHELVLNAYYHAIEEQYRFYSYGDCMLIT